MVSALLAAEPDHTQVDLLRPYEDSPKIYVQAMLPDGQPGLFMVDTGAGVSVIHTALAERLGLYVGPPQGYVTGLGGRVPLRRAVLPSLTLGDLSVGSLTVAVGVSGVPTHAGMMPVDGILGNDVWKNFVLVVDYPADILELHRPGTYEVPESAVPMDTDGSFPRVRATLSAADDPRHITQELLLEVDTGARGVILSGPTGVGFADLATEGVEPIYGVGAPEDLPPSVFYRTTRRIPLESVGIGAAVVTDTGPATWINFGDEEPFGPQDMAGLLGYSVLRGHMIVLDYPGQRFAMVESSRPARSINGHQVLLDQDRELYGRDKSRGLVRARYLVGLGDNEAALSELDRYLRRHSEDRQALMLQARLTRAAGEVETYRAQVERLGAGALVEQEEIIAAVNLALLLGNHGSAESLAEDAIAVQPESASAWIARSDVHLAEGLFREARLDLGQATRIQGNPNAELLRRARLALAENDPIAALSLLRTRIRLYPTEGDTFWFYGLAASELDDELALETYRADLEAALARLHPDLRPLDFAAAGFTMLGDHDRAQQLMSLGLARDCSDLVGASADNCVAWYHAMAGGNLDTALKRVTAAIEAEPNRADFQDTLAVVHLVRGEEDLALPAARIAARLAPDVIYHLWQADRIDRAAGSENR
jgi:tetratricopeptide (TPR) repeat protein